MKAALRAGGLVVTLKGCGDDIAPLLRRLISHAGGGDIRIEVQLFGGMRRTVRLADLDLDSASVHALNPHARNSMPGEDRMSRPSLAGDGPPSGTIEIPPGARRIA
jgi:hypothetical protein